MSNFFSDHFTEFEENSITFRLGGKEVEFQLLYLNISSIENNVINH